MKDDNDVLNNQNKELRVLHEGYIQSYRKESERLESLLHHAINSENIMGKSMIIIETENTLKDYQKLAELNAEPKIEQHTHSVQNAEIQMNTADLNTEIMKLQCELQHSIGELGTRRIS